MGVKNFTHIKSRLSNYPTEQVPGPGRIMIKRTRKNDNKTILGLFDSGSLAPGQTRVILIFPTIPELVYSFVADIQRDSEFTIAGEMVKLAMCLPHKHEDLSLAPSA